MYEQSFFCTDDKVMFALFCFFNTNYLKKLSGFEGLAPYVLVCTQAGVILSTLTSLDQLFSLKTALQMALLALAALIPSFVLRKSQPVA